MYPPTRPALNPLPAFANLSLKLFPLKLVAIPNVPDAKPVATPAIFFPPNASFSIFLNGFKVKSPFKSMFSIFFNISGNFLANNNAPKININVNIEDSCGFNPLHISEIINTDRNKAANLKNKSAHVTPTSFNHLLNIPFLDDAGSINDITGTGAIICKKYSLIVRTAISKQKLTKTRKTTNPTTVDNKKL